MVQGAMAGKAVRLPAVNLLVLLGAFLIALGAAGDGSRFLLGGAAILGLGLLLFWDEGRWTRELIHRGPAPAPTSRAPTPWWRRPLSYHGRWLCTACGWREESRTTFCPRCGKVLVQLPAPPAAKS